MGSKASDVWKFVVPVIPCGSSRKKYPACLRRSKAPTTKSSTSTVDLSSTLQQLRGEISALGARVSYVDEQIEHIKAALPDLDSKIRYASLGMPLSSLSLEEMLHLKGIHFKLLQFWEELSRKQLEKLGVLSDCLQVLEEQRTSAKSKQGEEHSGNEGSEDLEESYQEFEQHVSEKVESDLRKNQELEMKLYVDRISSVSDYSSKPATLLAQIPPERGPQGFASEQQMGAAAAKKLTRGESSKLQSEIRMEQLVLNPKKATVHVGAPTPPHTPPSTPSGIAAAAASSTGSLPRLAMSVSRCKAERGASAPTATPVLQPVQRVPSRVEV